MISGSFSNLNFLNRGVVCSRNGAFEIFLIARFWMSSIGLRFDGYADPQASWYEVEVEFYILIEVSILAKNI